MPHSFVLRLRDILIEQDAERRRQTDAFTQRITQHKNGNNHPGMGLDENSLLDAAEEFF
jgi:hypothetical protein